MRYVPVEIGAVRPEDEMRVRVTDDAAVRLAREFSRMNVSRIGDIDYLRQVGVIDVAELRFWPPAEASARFGMGIRAA